MGAVDLSSAGVIDGHCHPFRLSEIAERDPASFETRFTLTGACWVLGNSDDPRGSWRWPIVEELTERTVSTMALRRWLAAHLDCDATKEALARARAKALANDAAGYVNGLLSEEHLEGLVVDNGTPGYISHDEFEKAVDIPVYRAFRLETWIDAMKGSDYATFMDGLMNEAESVARHPRMVAFKSFIQFMTGGAIGDPSEADARASYNRWKDAGFTETSERAKLLWDFIIQRVMDIAKREGKAVLFHCGAEGNDPVIGRPFDFYPFLKQHDAQPIVLIHSGFPWVNETAYLATTFPEVYVDISEISLWAPGQIEWVVQLLLGCVPASRIMYGSDECVEPEQLWLAAKATRRSLERALNRYVELDFLTSDEAHTIGHAVLARNAKQLYGIPS